MSDIFRPLLGVVLFLTIFSCKKEEGPTAGIEVQPNENQLGLITTDTLEVICVTQKLDSVRTDGYTYNSVGSYNDPEFGITSNSLVTQIRLSAKNSDVNLFPTLDVDSVVLALEYQGYYGNIDAQNFYVYRLTEDLIVDSAYYSNHAIKTDVNYIGKKENYTPDPNGTFTENGDEQQGQLRIQLDSAFGRELLDADPLAYTSNDEFLKLFKGFHVKVDNPTQATNTGGQYLFDLEDEYSRLLLYYTDPQGDPGVIEYLINDDCVKFNISENDYSGSNVEAAFDDPIAGNQNFYLQAMGGVVAVFKVPHIKSLSKNGPIIINRAQYTLSMKTGSNSRFAPLLEIYPFGINENGDLFDTPDRKEGYFSGAFKDNLTYELNMNRYYQQVIDGKIEDNGIMIMELAENYGRTVISGPKATSTPFKFVVSYTPIN
ncbi:MAG: DUF4270 family protein [Salibacteraceae bacterium]